LIHHSESLEYLDASIDAQEQMATGVPASCLLEIAEPAERAMSCQLISLERILFLAKLQDLLHKKNTFYLFYSHQFLAIINLLFGCFRNPFC
tara:strand:+ start:719 stop:994 length:276 start_codon:yes stop_codon:yes gene_type:complete